MSRLGLCQKIFIFFQSLYRSSSVKGERDLLLIFMVVIIETAKRIRYHDPYRTRLAKIEIEVSSTPDNCDLEVNGAYQGLTPVSIELT